MLTLKQIDYALSVAKNLHFKKAADECFISPSTLSNAITELEMQPVSYTHLTLPTILRV